MPRSSGAVFVEYDPRRADTRVLHAALRATGYRTGRARIRFRIRGVTCASCVTRIEAVVRGTPGVLSAHVSLGSVEALVECVPAPTDLAGVKSAVAEAGDEVAERPPPAGETALDREAEASERESRTLMRQRWFGAAVGVFSMIMSDPSPPM